MKKITVLVLAVILLVSSVTVGAAPSNWAKEEVERAISMGIVPAKIQSYYQNNITREEFCEMAVLLFEKISGEQIVPAENVFTDTANENVLKAYSAGIVKGTSATTFSPESFITRQEICTMLTRVLVNTGRASAMADSYPNTFPDIENIADWALLSVQYMNINTVMLGDENGNINHTGNTTREQAILLAYRVAKNLDSQTNNFIVSMFMSSSGNTQCNMINGAFCIYRDEVLYVSDGNCVRKVSDSGETVLLEEGAERILSQTEALYYIKKSDNKIYKKDLTSLEESLLCDMRVSEMLSLNDRIYFISADDGAVYFVNNQGGTAQKYEEGGTQCPMASGSDTLITDNSAIYKIDKDGVRTKIYEGANKKLSVKNNDVYFIDGEDYLCKINKDGTGFARASKIQIKEYCTTVSNIVALTTAGEVYKLDYDGRYTIKIEFDTYENINTYDNYVYGKKTTGEVVKFKNDSTEKVTL